SSEARDVRCWASADQPFHTLDVRILSGFGLGLRNVRLTETSRSIREAPNAPLRTSSIYPPIRFSVLSGTSMLFRGNPPSGATSDHVWPNTSLNEQECDPKSARLPWRTEQYCDCFKGPTSPKILPRWPKSRGGASVVRREGAADRRRNPMAKSAKKRTARPKQPQPRRKSHHDPNKNSNAQAKTRTGTKQDCAIEMLRSKEGSSLAALMEATGWQQHSVRGFLAGVVRKRLKLNLSSAVDAGVRTYRITGEPAVPASKDLGAKPKSS